VWPVVVNWIDKEQYEELTYLFLASDLIEAKSVDEIRTLIERSEKMDRSAPIDKTFRSQINGAKS
jgi:hypothetical protein